MTDSSDGREFAGALRFPRCLLQFWQDFQDDKKWKYEALPPLQLLRESKLNVYLINRDELARAKWMWSRAPRLLLAISLALWLILTFGVPFWFIIPKMGFLCLALWIIAASMETVRSVRWRRDYERSITRTIRTSGTGRAADPAEQKLDNTAHHYTRF